MEIYDLKEPVNMYSEICSDLLARSKKNSDMTYLINAAALTPTDTHPFKKKYIFSFE